jgi:uncharacterized membrane protein
VPAVSAYTIENLETEFYLFESNIVVETSINLSENTAQFEWLVPEDAESISVNIEGKKENFTKTESKIIINTTAKNIKISYLTEEFIDNENFLLSFIAPTHIKDANFSLILPEGAVLKKPLKNGVSGSIYPKPSSVSTDGRSLIFAWSLSEMEKGSELPIFVSYKLQKDYTYLIVFLIIMLSAALSSAFAIYKKKPKIQEKIIREDLIEKHLKEDEEIIVNVLKKRENKACEQGTIRIITGFSKASLSRLLKELEDRKVIKKEKRGKKNIIFLK